MPVTTRSPKAIDPVRAWVKLLRPLNMAMLGTGVVVGGLLVAGAAALQYDALHRLVLAAVSAALIGGGANALNDVFDVEIDRINRPDRPLPSGAVSVVGARVAWATTSIAGGVLAVFLSPWHVALAAASIGLLYAYSAWLKRRLLLGNVVVGLALGLTLVYGGMTVGGVGPALVGALFAFLTTLAREIVKDIEDARGDATVQARTLPLVHGVPTAATVAVSMMVLTALATPVPYLVLQYSGLYLLLVLVTDALLLRAVWLLAERRERSFATSASRILKVAMLVGLGALACAEWTGT